MSDTFSPETTKQAYLDACEQMEKALANPNSIFEDIYFAAKDLFYAANDYMWET